MLLSIQFKHNQTPTAALAVWACVVHAGTMQHPTLLGGDNWMRFDRRSYTTLPREPQLPHQPPQPTRGELSLHHHDPNRASAFILNDLYTNDIYHLRFADTKDLSISSSPQFVKVNLVRQSGAREYTGHYMVNMLSRKDLLPDKVLLVSDGHLTIPLPGSTDLEPGDLLRTSLSQLVQVPLTTHRHPSAYAGRICPTRPHPCG